MTPDYLAADLPPARDDEPESLRQDIVDELADHLQCAVNRELHTTRDPESAKRNAVKHFGNPAQVARRLYFDAMKEKIMSQRILIAAVVILAVACLAVSGLAWTALHDSQELNRAILAKLEAIPAASPSVAAQHLDWIPVGARLTSESQDGPAATGFHVELTGNLTRDGVEETREETIKDAANVDFGLVRPGDYKLTSTSPWGESSVVNISVRPGEPQLAKIVCPAQPLPKVPISVQVNWPDDFKSKQLKVICDFVQDPRTIADTEWRSRRRKNQRAASVQGGAVVCVDTDGAVSASFKAFDVNHELLVPVRSAVGGRGRPQRTLLLVDCDNPQTTFICHESAKLEQATYRLAKILIVRPVAARGQKFASGRAAAGPRGFEPILPQDDALEVLGEFAFAQDGQKTAWQHFPSFEVQPDSETKWQIALPDGLTQQVRKAISEIDAQPTGPAPEL